MKCLYLCGAISKDPNYREKFNSAEKKLTDLGYFVNNPVSMGLPTEEKSWNYAMRKALEMMLGSDAVAFFDDWKESKGATIEIRLAQDIQMESWPVDIWVLRAGK